MAQMQSTLLRETGAHTLKTPISSEKPPPEILGQQLTPHLRLLLQTANWLWTDHELKFLQLARKPSESQQKKTAIFFHQFDNKLFTYVKISKSLKRSNPEKTNVSYLAYDRSVHGKLLAIAEVAKQ